MARSRKNAHVFDDHVTFNKADKIPYGTYIAYNNLQHLFPHATILVNTRQPGSWVSLNNDADHQALVIIAPSFRADEFEMKKLIDFVKNGNTVFVSAAILSYEVQNMLRCDAPDAYSVSENLALNNNADSFTVTLANPPFPVMQEYGCPGLRFESYFSKYDSATTTVLGNGAYILPNFIRLTAGKGNMYFHLTPLSFSNYFLLYDKNIAYYDKTMSLIPGSTKKIVWDEYFLHKKYYSYNAGAGRSHSMISVLMKNASFRAALLVLIVLILLYVLQEMRRKQRMIPEMMRPGNDSLDFVKTVGRLYYEKGDNTNLSRKMSAYFLEHVRNKYKISTNKLDDGFVLSLQKKTGYPESMIREITSFINSLDEEPLVTDERLVDFHRQLEEFYKRG
ncbi:MAG TPA: DUF4350 domain-containing protein [Chitinophagaceae bacterium]|nr:DUF4350 domain-containing protein [Chitinophagaceae bacterium]